MFLPHNTALALGLVAALTTVARSAEPPVPSYRDHTQLLVYQDASGHEQPVRTADEWAVRRQQILTGMQAVMGPLPDRVVREPLDAQLREEEQGDGYRRFTLTICAEGKDRLPLDLYLPAGQWASERRPAILALHPTSPLGKRVIGGEGKGTNRPYAVELAQRGYVVLAPDYPSFGDYRYDFAADRYVSGTMKGIFNHMRCLDFLESRFDVDPKRIGVVGHSLGGHNALFLAAFDPRVQVVVASCGWTPFHAYEGGDLKGWAGDRYMPLLKTRYDLNADRVPFDFPEIVAALAPRLFFSNSPLHDNNFDVEGVRQGISQARGVYELLGVGENLQVRYPDCGHDFPVEVRREAYEYLDRVLQFTPLRQVP